MKYPKKIRQPKKAKKVTLARIREIVKEELSALFTPDMDYPTFKNLREDLPKLMSDKPHDGGTSIHAPFMYEREEKPMYFPPTTIKPVPPPPRVSRVSANLAYIPPPPLPDEYEVDEGESNAASK